MSLIFILRLGRPPSVEPPPSDLSEAPRPQQLQPLTLVKSRASQTNGNVDIPINLVPPSPTPSRNADMSDNEKQDDKEQHKGKKVQRILKDQVHRGQAHIHTISKKIGAKHGMRIRRSSSTPGKAKTNFIIIKVMPFLVRFCSRSNRLEAISGFIHSFTSTIIYQPHS